MTLRQHLAYARYVARHKWFVLCACRLTGCSLWRGLVHDLSKLHPSEWGPYARTFYAADGSKRYDPSPEFDQAWNAHQKRNKHHWQWWVVRNDGGNSFAVPMPYAIVREMVADWIGAGRAITGRIEVWDWYAKNRHKMLLHETTERRVERVLETVGARIELYS